MKLQAKETNIWEETILTPEPPTPEQVDRARRVVCAHAADAAEADKLMRMLGLL